MKASLLRKAPRWKLMVSAADVSASLGREIVAIVPEHPPADVAQAIGGSTWPALDHVTSVVVEKVGGSAREAAAA